MKKKTRPSGLIYQFLRMIAVLIIKLKCRFRVDRSGLKEIKGGYLLLFNHHSNFDFLLVATGLGFRRVNFVVSSYFYRNKLVSKILHITKCISKDQFKPDLKAIRGIKAVIDEKGIVVIAPSGQVSINGESTFVSPSIVKLVRLCKADVVAMVLSGAHLAFPKWRKTKRRGRIEGRYIRIIRKDELPSLSDDEIYKRIEEMIDVNDYTWQKTHMYPIKGKGLIEGLENILYYCPKCSSEFENITHGDIMRCKHCGNTVTMDKFGFLHPANDQSVCFDNEVLWYHRQKELMKEELKNPTFELKMPVVLKKAEEGSSSFEDAGTGILIFNREEIIYQGTIDGEETVRHYPMKTIIQLPFAPARHVEIPNNEAEFLFQPLENQAQVIKWVIATDILNDEKQKQNNEE
jgi:1-acyl-sn-glycerol-3-phosphate acyltransferase